MTHTTPPTIAVFGAGSTGCYLAAELLLAKLDVTIICRQRIKNSIMTHQGIHISDYLGMQQTIMPSNILTEIDLTNDNNSQYDVIFVTLKSHQIAMIYPDLQAISHANTEIIFMQNGIGSFDEAKYKLVQQQLYQGITPFNVLQKDKARFHKGTEGHFIWPKTQFTQIIAKAMHQHQLNCELTNNMQAVICGKLLLNLNNALNAISNLPIKTQLQQRPYASCWPRQCKSGLMYVKKLSFPLSNLLNWPPNGCQ
ncbi:2-dehydropantoate 2-reductase N-terminal domain-containing protein [Shewanella aestuarii]|uniref:2-dehydropantoate 2-reductase N-terminal domain-containing protein n=1 Tax=Shewanella aestuarii TaxID=1028752 RepID=UPI001FCAC3D5|nr:2-dehydropantoate 2-reductase N-terminal domain-containing protein [Shewanella aestuarii]